MPPLMWLAGAITMPAPFSRHNTRSSSVSRQECLAYHVQDQMTAPPVADRRWFRMTAEWAPDTTGSPDTTPRMTVGDITRSNTLGRFPREPFRMPAWINRGVPSVAASLSFGFRPVTWDDDQLGLRTQDDGKGHRACNRIGILVVRDAGRSGISGPSQAVSSHVNVGCLTRHPTFIHSHAAMVT